MPSKILPYPKDIATQEGLPSSLPDKVEYTRVDVGVTKVA